VDAVVAAARSAGRIVSVDPNPGNPVHWHDVTCVTPNRTEAFQAAGIPWTDPVEPPIDDQALRKVGKLLLEKWRCEQLLVTLSEHGMMLFHGNDEPFHIPTRAQEVFDVSGAGDTAIALFTTALAGGATPPQAAEISNHASGIVVGKLGTATVTREELLGSFGE
jgi:D-beta-D-heptose 7-phosphate kinase/D-beta-D-heptose 1-phosphate adenosyltransferase